MNPIDGAIRFLIETIFGLYLFIVLLRLVMPWIRADFYHPLSQFVIKMTEPLLSPLKQIVPRMPYLDLSVLILLFLLTAIKLLLLFVIQFKFMPNLFGFFIWVVADICEQGINLMFFAILIVVIFSWVNPGSPHPVISLLYQLTEPYLSWFRKKIPVVAGFDLSPIPALMVLKLLSLVLVLPIWDLGFRMSM